MATKSGLFSDRTRNIFGMNSAAGTQSPSAFMERTALATEEAAVEDQDFHIDLLKELIEQRKLLKAIASNTRALGGGGSLAEWVDALADFKKGKGSSRIDSRGRTLPQRDERGRFRRTERQYGRSSVPRTGTGSLYDTPDVQGKTRNWSRKFTSGLGTSLDRSVQTVRQAGQTLNTTVTNQTGRFTRSMRQTTSRTLGALNRGVRRGLGGVTSAIGSGMARLGGMIAAAFAINSGVEAYQNSTKATTSSRAADGAAAGVDTLSGGLLSAGTNAVVGKNFNGVLDDLIGDLRKRTLGDVSGPVTRENWNKKLIDSILFNGQFPGWLPPTQQKTGVDTGRFGDTTSALPASAATTNYFDRRRREAETAKVARITAQNFVANNGASAVDVAQEAVGRVVQQTPPATTVTPTQVMQDNNAVIKQSTEAQLNTARDMKSSVMFLTTMMAKSMYSYVQTTDALTDTLKKSLRDNITKPFMDNIVHNGQLTPAQQIMQEPNKNFGRESFGVGPSANNSGVTAGVGNGGPRDYFGNTPKMQQSPGILASRSMAAEAMSLAQGPIASTSGFTGSADVNYSLMTAGKPGTARDRREEVLNALTDAGFSRHDAAAYAGNFSQESKFDPRAVGDSGAAFGLAQWRDERRTNLMNFSRENGLDPASIKAQAMFVAEESRRGSKYADGQAVNLKERLEKTPLSAMGVRERAKAVSDRYERPNAYYANNDARMAAAAEIASMPSRDKTSAGLLDPSSIPLSGGKSAVGDTSNLVQSQSRLAQTRSQPTQDQLNANISRTLMQTLGPGFTAEVYSGGQPMKGEGGKRVGTTRHDGGNAADLKIFGPDGKQITQEQYATVAQAYLARGLGGVGMQMKGGGIHLDKHTDRANFWTYDKEGGIPLGKKARELVQMGRSGQMPALKISDEEYAAMNAGSNVRSVPITPDMLRPEAGSLQGRGIGRLIARQPGSTDVSGKFDRSAGVTTVMTPEGTRMVPTAQTKALERQGQAVGRGIVQAQKETMRVKSDMPSFSSLSNPPSDPTPQLKQADTKKSGQANGVTAAPKPSEIRHFDEFAMLFANSSLSS